ncbi:MAG: UDP-3-O-[3-hydroxymyristoyl] N-acetylglucosamine deacetylase [Candidatus Magnetoglobus multicellularis str. Araruama]|uniref:UDP-3-O-acyl-N-acetylglucosamine deacetylase n=1 Tax=Candidatus Magnetoglobus multicellularis str. Araruama TaxID=890399 RepID=A0A1V1PAN5_9BACT|nr:MAG: UDP-3-O-[3-hydroxymyristoyl] N-acetylglucosamine deacetylase [Candidatus Magnetoglobus multicellularis str. Araruama]
MDKQQKTISKPVSCQGVGLHSGQTVTLTLKPGKPNQGRVFVRTDLPGRPQITAIFQRVVDTSLATVLGADGAIVSTTEHLMAALTGMGIDNIVIEMDAYEVPIMDGSAVKFSDLIAQGEIVSQDSAKIVFSIKEPIEITQGEKRVYLEPYDGFKITCAIDFNHPLIGYQEYSLDVTPNRFAAEIAPARTFGFLHELDMMRHFGLAKGGSLDNAIVVDQDKILNEGGLRFDNEFVRHKILDCIGDFSLLGIPVCGHINIYKSGHALHHLFLESFFAKKDCWKTETL